MIRLKKWKKKKKKFILLAVQLGQINCRDFLQQYEHLREYLQQKLFELFRHVVLAHHLVDAIKCQQTGGIVQLNVFENNFELRWL